jgi:hypothetical protein
MLTDALNKLSLNPSIQKQFGDENINVLQNFAAQIEVSGGQIPGLNGYNPTVIDVNHFIGED